MPNLELVSFDLMVLTIFLFTSLNYRVDDRLI